MKKRRMSFLEYVKTTHHRGLQKKRGWKIKKEGKQNDII